MSVPAPAPRVRDASPDDAPAIADIYNHYVRESTATFEIDPLADAQIAARIAAVQADGFPWLVAEYDGALVGYAYAGKLGTRAAYRHSVESSVYLAPHATGLGLGSALYGELLPRLRALGLHVVVGVIALPNPGSVALHEKFGMRQVGELTQVGRKFDTWIDVGYWQLTFAEDDLSP